MIFPLHNQIFDCQKEKEGCATRHNKAHEWGNLVRLTPTNRADLKSPQIESGQERELNVTPPYVCSPID